MADSFLWGTSSPNDFIWLFYGCGGRAKIKSVFSRRHCLSLLLTELFTAVVAAAFLFCFVFLLVLLRSLQHRGFKFLTVLFKKTKKLMSHCAAKLPLVLCFEVINSLMCSVT